MQKIEATGYEDFVPDDRPALYVSHGAGNRPGVEEVHLTAIDPEDGTEIRLWVPRAELLAALEINQKEAV